MPLIAVQPQSPHAVDALFAAFRDNTEPAILDFHIPSGLAIVFALLGAELRVEGLAHLWDKSYAFTIVFKWRGARACR
jgi:hypothetical protein